ncbi:MAG TPA: amidase [Polyangiales bacterium]|nr:amidase [Polyangiales bacterium]
MPEWYFESARVLARRIRKRELSSVELLDAMLARIEKVNPPLNAVVTLDPERARAEAQRADELLASGVAVGPLHGVPMTVKDAYEVSGFRTTAGAKRWTDHVPAADALAIRRLRDAGVIIVGKTNTPAHCADWQSFNEIFGTTNNPYDVSRTPGGSSGGAAAALASGMTPIELGSDIAGSVRVPPAFCGVYGHKSTHDLVPMRGHIPPAPGTLGFQDLVVSGPMARTADDLALMLPLIAGPVPEIAKAYSVRLPPPRAATLRGYRVAAWFDDSAFPVDTESRALLQASVAALRKAGVSVDDARPEFTLAEAHANYRVLFDPIIPSAAPQKVVTQLEAAAAGPQTEPLVITARNSIAPHYLWIRADEERAQLRAKLARFFENYDVLLCPVTQLPAFPHDHTLPQFMRTLTVNGKTLRYTDVMGWMSFATLTGNPATVAPIGQTAAGLPVGVQIVAPYLEDLTSIDFAGRLSEVIGGFVPPPGY